MRTLVKAAVVIALACAVAAPFAAYAADDTNPDGSIKTGNFIGQNPAWNFGLFTVLTSGNLNDTNNTETGPSVITGNVGIGGQGNFSMSDGQLNGDLYMNSYGTFTMSGPARHNGNTFQDHSHGGTVDTTLSNALAAANYLYLQAKSETPSPSSSYTVTQGSFTQGQSVNITNSNQNITIADKNPFGGSKIVLSINNFVLNNGTFTLKGTAATTYILNISGQFQINNSSAILSGGLLASHVLFNLTGSQSAQGTVTMQQGTSLTGILLAINRQVDLSGGKVFGKVIAEQLTVTSGGQVISQ